MITRMLYIVFFIGVKLINIMQESRRSVVGKSLPNSVFQKFQGIYNEEDHQLKQNQKMRKLLLSKIMEKEHEMNSQKKQVQRQFKQRQNKEIDLFWRNEEERLRAMERKRKEDIDQARRVNSSNFNQLLSKSMEVDPYHLQKSFKDDLSTFQEKQRLKRQHMKQYYYQGMVAEEARQQKRKYDRDLQHLIFSKKQQQDRELNARKEQFYSNWRQKHFQQKHPDTIKLVSQINQRNQNEKSQLQQLIAVKGGYQLAQRVAALRGAQLNQKMAKKEQHNRQLKHQIQQNTYKSAIDRYLELNYQKKRMDQMGKLLDNKDMMQKQQKKEQNNEHLKVLKNQFRPRVLLQQPDKIEAAGIGSPAHIGKIVHDDRIKQLKWIERSYLQQLKHL